MGNDAQVNVWVGVRSEDCDIAELKEQMPKGLFDKDGCNLFGDKEVKKAEKEFGCVPKTIDCCEEYTGYGVVVFCHDWDYGNIPFDLITISDKIVTAQIKLRQLFDKYGIKQKIGVWCQTDWG
jgi:hypothetical protein